MLAILTALFLSYIKPHINTIYNSTYHYIKPIFQRKPITEKWNRGESLTEEEYQEMLRENEIDTTFVKLF